MNALTLSLDRTSASPSARLLAPAARLAEAAQLESFGVRKHREPAMPSKLSNRSAVLGTVCLIAVVLCFCAGTKFVSIANQGAPVIGTCEDLSGLHPNRCHAIRELVR